MLRFIRSLSRDERGISALEYAILAGVLLVVIVGGVMTMKGSIQTIFSNAESAVSSAAAS